MNSRRNPGQTKELLLSAKLRTELERSRALRSQLQTELRLMTEIVASYRQSPHDEPLFDTQLRHSESRQAADDSEGHEEDQQVVRTVYIDGLKLYPKTSTVMEIVHKALAATRPPHQQQQHQQHHSAFQRQPSFA